MPVKSSDAGRRARPALSRRRKLAYVAIAFVAVALISGALLVAADVYVHHRVQYDAGVNVWGFITVDVQRGIVYMPFGAPSVAGPR